TAISLQNVAIDPDRARSKFFKINNCSQRPANQTLNLYAATIDPAFCDIARFSGPGRVREHRIFGSKPAAGYRLLFHPARHVFFNHDAADDTGVAHCNEHRTTRVWCDSELESNRTQLIAGSSVNSAHYGKGRSAHELSAPCSFLRGIFLISRRPWLDRINEPFRIGL